MHEFVVPKSMPITLAIKLLLDKGIHCPQSSDDAKMQAM